MPRRTAVARALMLLSLTAPPRAARADDAAKDQAADFKAMAGEWVSKDEQGESTWTFKGDRLAIKIPTRAYELSLKLDPAAKPARSIDFHATADSPNAKGADAHGIYKFDGEKLLICFNGPEGDRPTEFKSDFPKALLFELTRKK